jgi:hypothetical protein
MRAEAAIDWAEDRAAKQSCERWDEEEKISYRLRFIANADIQQYAVGKSDWESTIEACLGLELFNSEDNG